MLLEHVHSDDLHLLFCWDIETFNKTDRRGSWVKVFYLKTEVSSEKHSNHYNKVIFSIKDTDFVTVITRILWKLGYHVYAWCTIEKMQKACLFLL